jgi:hypothetical protein
VCRSQRVVGYAYIVSVPSSPRVVHACCWPRATPLTTSPRCPGPRHPLPTLAHTPVYTLYPSWSGEAGMACDRVTAQTGCLHSSLARVSSCQASAAGKLPLAPASPMRRRCVRTGDRETEKQRHRGRPEHGGHHAADGRRGCHGESQWGGEDCGGWVTSSVRG